MNPYIDPWFFYWTDFMNSANDVLIFISVLCAIAAGIMTLIALANGFYDEDYKENMRIIRKPLVTILIVGLASAAVSVVLPSEETMIKMLIAKGITPDTVTNGIEAIKEAVDYIFQKIAEIR